MFKRCLPFLSVGIVAWTAVPATAQNKLDEPDLQAIYRIKQEAVQGSQLDETLFYLTDVHGPRLTRSPGYIAAAKWATDQLTEWGISNPRLEKWGRVRSRVVLFTALGPYAGARGDDASRSALGLVCRDRWTGQRRCNPGHRFHRSSRSQRNRGGDQRLLGEIQGQA